MERAVEPEIQFKFEGTLWLYSGAKASWHFVTVPKRFLIKSGFLSGADRPVSALSGSVSQLEKPAGRHPFFQTRHLGVSFSRSKLMCAKPKDYRWETSQCIRLRPEREPIFNAMTGTLF